jgi:hypothetical protein
MFTESYKKSEKKEHTHIKSEETVFIPVRYIAVFMIPNIHYTHPFITPVCFILFGLNPLPKLQHLLVCALAFSD